MITIVALGPGAADAVPAAALETIRAAPRVLAPPLEPDLVRALGIELDPLADLADIEGDAAIVAPDAAAHALALRMPEAHTMPGRAALRDRAIGAEVAALAAVGAHLRIECPWDREQTAQTIVPHTIEEAFEVAEAVASREPEALADELGDLLFQAVFLAQLEEERGHSDLGAVARGQIAKLVSRHPHVYGDAQAEGPDGVRDLWERRKREERSEQGVFHDLPSGLPALAYATKAQKRAASVGFQFRSVAEAQEKLTEEVGELTDDPGERELGDVLFATVAVARALRVDPELALRAAAGRFRARVERSAQLAVDGGRRLEDLDADAWLALYERALDDAK